MQQTETITATMAAFPKDPASPTLTNPDMILPYGEYDSTPSPPRRSFRTASDGEEWRGPIPASLPFSIGPPHTPLSSRTSVTPIIYGNGTMLSDIGEVTEAESNPGRKLPGPAQRRLLKQAQSLPLRSGPTAGQGGAKQARYGVHGRKVSVESASTVTDEPQSAEVFKDFDDGVSVDDSNFQGDDEGSVADSYSEEVVAMEIQRLSRLESSLARDDDPNSSAALSRRAEQILLNAKKRLNNMEGNLTRARSSLYITPSGLMSSIHSSSPLSRPNPSPQNDPRILPQLGVSPATHRQSHAAVGPTPGHSRAYSENSIASGLRSTAFPTQPAIPAQYIDKRAEGNRSSPPSNRSQDITREEARLSGISSSFGRSSPPHGVYLEPLDEDGALPEFDMDHVDIRFALEEEFLNSSEDPQGLTRSTSSLQMRDLRDQMHDLKGRLSVLRDRTRDDTMKRRSLQSLRTPSPFTAAEEWYTTDKNYVAPGLSTDAGVGHSSEMKTEGVHHTMDDNPLKVSEGAVAKLPEHTSSETASIYEEASEGHYTEDFADSHDPRTFQDLQGESLERTTADDKYKEPGEEDDEYEEPGDEADNDYNDEIASHDELDVYESDASIYHDATSISHEDREDAFDYEHFFLHSAMGTINQQRLERRGSFSSDSSVETTRGPQTAILDGEAQNNVNKSSSFSLLRAESAASISTMDTFATAMEGLEPETDDQEDPYDYAVQQAVALPVRSITPDVVKRSIVESPVKTSPRGGRQTPAGETDRPTSAIYNPGDQEGRNIHRPSVASTDSFQSTGTTRNFPLVNKSTSHKSVGSNGILDYRSSQQNGSLPDGGRSLASPVQMLPREDQLLVEKLVTSLGNCVSGLQDAPTGSSDVALWRRRLEEARRILNGEDGTM